MEEQVTKDNKIVVSDGTAIETEDAISSIVGTRDIMLRRNVERKGAGDKSQVWILYFMGAFASACVWSCL